MRVCVSEGVCVYVCVCVFCVAVRSGVYSYLMYIWLAVARDPTGPKKKSGLGQGQGAHKDKRGSGQRSAQPLEYTDTSLLGVAVQNQVAVAGAPGCGDRRTGRRTRRGLVSRLSPAVGSLQFADPRRAFFGSDLPQFRTTVE